MRSLGLSIRIRALLSLGEADRDRRASCLFYVEGARPPEAFHANIIGTESWAGRSAPTRFGHVDCHASMSLQIFRAQAKAYSPSSAVGPGDKPPEPGTVANVFFSLSYWCTESTCTTSLSVMKL